MLLEINLPLSILYDHINYKTGSMHLNMYINDRLIDSIQINSELITKIRIFQAQLEDKHSEILDLYNEDPVYFIEGYPSRINENKVILIQPFTIN